MLYQAAFQKIYVKLLTTVLYHDYKKIFKKKNKKMNPTIGRKKKKNKNRQFIQKVLFF